MASASELRASMASKRGFAHAGAGENAHALAVAAGGEGIERAHAQIQFAADAAAAWWPAAARP